MIFLRRVLKFIALFKDKELFNFAASLSFYTIMSLIPLLFVVFSAFTQISSFETYLQRAKNVIFTFLIPAQQELVSKYLDTFLGNSVNLGLVGLVAMAFTSLAFFSSYDFVIGRITKNDSKGLWQSISSYWTLLTLVPLGLGLSFYISGLIQNALDSYKIGFNFFEILPFLIIWGLFLVSYSSSLHKGSLKNLLSSSFLGALIWWICKNLFVYYVVLNKSYTSVYGSFSAILFFFIWIYISWVIYLFCFKLYYFLSSKSGEEKDPKTPSQTTTTRRKKLKNN